MKKDIVKAIEKAKKIKLVVFDVHGVLTPNMVYYNDEGEKFRPFCHMDGFGINAMKLCGVEVAWITRKSKVSQIRAEEIGVKRFYEAKDKVAKTKEIMEEMGITAEEVAFVGDEIIDLAAMNMAGMAVAPADAGEEAIDAADYVTACNGGKGVARDLGEFILRAQGKWDKFCEKVKSKGW